MPIREDGSLDLVGLFPESVAGLRKRDCPTAGLSSV